jgi:voltage-dependent potassium channel beta subunit
MQYRRLGRSGLTVSEIAYGNWITHGSQVEERTALACVAAALEHGITMFDTADVYAAGRAEMVLGKALRGVRRAAVQISTKVFWPSGPGPNDRGLSRKHIMESAHASLRRLGTDYLDLYQAHRYDSATPLEETLRAFDDLVRQGKALYIGVSEWRAEEIAAAVRVAGQMGLDRIVSNQPQYNIIWRVIESEVIPVCQQVGVGQAVWSPLAQGTLTGKYQPGAAPPAGSRATSEEGGGFIAEFLRDEVLRGVQRLKPVAAQAGLTVAQLAVAWTLQNPAVSCAIVGAGEPGQVRDNVKASGVRLDPVVMRQIDDIFAGQIVTDPVYTPNSRNRRPWSAPVSGASPPARG